MHELSLATEIIELIKPSIPEGTALQSVQITVGPLAGICTDALTFCFVELAKQNGHESAVLEIMQSPIRFECISCGNEYEVSSVEELCPTCASSTRQMSGGAEFRVDSIEIEN